MQASSTTAPVELDDRSVIKPRLHHINLKTTRLAQLVDWYGVLVGAEPNFRNDGFAFVSNDDAHHRIAIVALPGVYPDDARREHDGMHHVAFEYDDLDGLLGTYLRLRAKGILPRVCLDHGMTTSFYYRDPDGNFVELQSDNFGSWADSTEFLRSDPRFVADQLGPFLDPEKLVRARRSGMSAAEIHERGYAGEFEPQPVPDVETLAA